MGILVGMVVVMALIAFGGNIIKGKKEAEQGNTDKQDKQDKKDNTDEQDKK